MAGVSHAVPTDAQIDLKILIIASQQAGSTPELAAAQSILDRVGIPYTIYAYDTNNPTLPPLETADHALYQAIILPISDYRYMNPFAGGALAQTLARYQFKYNVRLASFYTWPSDNACLQYVNYQDTSATPLPSVLTTAGQTIFPYLNAGTSATNPLTISGAWTYLASPASPLPTGTTVTPFLQATVSGTTYSLGATCLFANTTPLAGDSASREILSLTFDNSQYLTHSITLSYGIANWLTRGLFLGSRHVFLSPQVDDVGIPDEIFPYAQSDTTALWYNATTGATTSTNPPGQCPLGSPVGSTNPATGTTACEYRIIGSDFSNIVNWQSNVNRTTPNAAAFQMTIAFNGAGFSTAYGGEGNFPTTGTDSLTTQVAALQGAFAWLSHTYDHQLLDPPYTTTASQVTSEMQKNVNVANKFRFRSFTRSAMVTPGITGLYNTTTLGALQGFGLTLLVSDSSLPTPPVGTSGCPTTNNGAKWPLPAFNAGKYNCVNTTIFEVPRYATGLFYNVSQPSEWVAEYNYFYGANGIDPTRFGYDLTYSQVLSEVASQLLVYMITYDNRPLMFHQSNLRAYSGTSTLLSDLFNTLFAQYNLYYRNLPIESESLSSIGALAQQRMIYDSSNVVATLTPGKSIVVSGSRTDGQSVVVPVTGVTFGTSTETYGGQKISNITLLPATAYTTQITPAPAWQ